MAFTELHMQLSWKREHFINKIISCFTDVLFFVFSLVQFKELVLTSSFNKLPSQASLGLESSFSTQRRWLK